MEYTFRSSWANTLLTSAQTASFAYLIYILQHKLRFGWGNISLTSFFVWASIFLIYLISMRNSKVLVSNGELIFKKAAIGSKEEGKYPINSNKFEFEAERNVLYRFFYGTTYRIYAYQQRILDMPVLPEAGDVSINREDIRYDVFRADTDLPYYTWSGVRLTHLPTKIVVASQDKGSQIKNRDEAMKLLQTKLLEAEISLRASDGYKVKKHMHRVTISKKSMLELFNLLDNKKARS
jgi:hypothetical protein